MFSKALFKQSCKANGIMWAIITFANCFILACVMLVSGGGTMSEVKNQIQDTMIQSEIESQAKNMSINYYDRGQDGLEEFNVIFKEEFSKHFEVPAVTVEISFGDLSDIEALKQKIMEQFTTAFTESMTTAINDSNEAIQTRWMQYADTVGGSEEAASQLKLLYGFLLNPQLDPEKPREADFIYQEVGETEKIDNGESYYHPLKVHVTGSIYGQNVDVTMPEDQNGMTLEIVLNGKLNGLTIELNGTYSFGQDDTTYINHYVRSAVPVMVGYGMTSDEAIDEMVKALEDYGMTKEKYLSFGFDYPKIKTISIKTIESFIAQLDALIRELPDDQQNDPDAIAKLTKEIAGDITQSFLSTLPETAAEAMEDLGKIDLYNMIVGSIYYQMAGLLLPIIYVIMCSNSLIAGQVDSGSMAFILSTSTKRKQVTFTQAFYLIFSLFMMNLLTTIVSISCLAIVKSPDIALTYGQLLLLNFGQFMTLFAISGLCFMTSCLFSRAKKAMAIGGGISMFFLVATMLGLFGSKTLPSMLRMDALNYFNYVSIISFFDVVSITSNTLDYLWKLAFLLVIGVVCYLVGHFTFKKKDLPL